MQGTWLHFSKLASSSLKDWCRNLLQGCQNLEIMIRNHLIGHLLLTGSSGTFFFPLRMREESTLESLNRVVAIFV